jgi:hypothetical protein
MLLRFLAMLPPFIIEQIREREEREREERDREQPRLELPLPTRRSAPPKQGGDEANRGVTEIQIW